MQINEHALPSRHATGIPPHLADWQLPPEWRWGVGGVYTPHRYAHEVIDSLGRSLALVTAPDARDPALLTKLDAVAGRVLR